MKTRNLFSILTLFLIFACASTSEVVYDYNLEVDFNQFETYVLCMDDFFVEHTNHPQMDNEEIRRLIGDAVAIEIENKGHRTNVLNPELQAGFRLLISEETAEFTDCEHSEELEYWENCTIHTQTFEEETLVVYVADFESKKVLWHASIICDLNQPKKKLKSYVNGLVKELYETYPKTLVAPNPDEAKEYEVF
ncbi:DUF4136 domain-containing protein [Winogradskyella alexanderae]|uniref:DUF4136 domain-containing protein n=1 Tax=Winogradskyella alexanderae TaxID=2877123 RepID=A0ABS7XQI6_9FLAO|nr:DUF4136 domain-containing protein [Winogradskyella alexanderae]MCA0131789.1 DUF4136 domain-containing protein [Winogradskyella alexanderae]